MLSSFYSVRVEKIAVAIKEDAMPSTLEAFTQQVNFTRYHGQPHGHYESFFQRANHPTRPLAFWIRYTIFSPKDRPNDALGELWAIFFNGETGSHVAVKKEAPPVNCDLRIGSRIKRRYCLPGTGQRLRYSPMTEIMA